MFFCEYCTSIIGSSAEQDVNKLSPLLRREDIKSDLDVLGHYDLSAEILLQTFTDENLQKYFMVENVQVRHLSKQMVEYNDHPASLYKWLPGLVDDVNKVMIRFSIIPPVQSKYYKFDITLFLDGTCFKK